MRPDMHHRLVINKICCVERIKYASDQTTWSSEGFPHSNFQTSLLFLRWKFMKQINDKGWSTFDLRFVKNKTSYYFHFKIAAHRARIAGHSDRVSAIIYITDCWTGFAKNVLYEVPPNKNALVFLYHTDNFQSLIQTFCSIPSMYVTEKFFLYLNFFSLKIWKSCRHIFKTDMRDNVVSVTMETEHFTKRHFKIV